MPDVLVPNDKGSKYHKYRILPCPICKSECGMYMHGEENRQISIQCHGCGFWSSQDLRSVVNNHNPRIKIGEGRKTIGLTTDRLESGSFFRWKREAAAVAQ